MTRKSALMTLALAGGLVLASAGVAGADTGPTVGQARAMVGDGKVLSVCTGGDGLLGGLVEVSLLGSSCVEVPPGIPDSTPVSAIEAPGGHLAGCLLDLDLRLAIVDVACTALPF